MKLVLRVDRTRNIQTIMMQEMRLMQMMLWLPVQKSQTVGAHQRHAPPPALPAVVCQYLHVVHHHGLEKEQEEALFSDCWTLGIILCIYSLNYILGSQYPIDTLIKPRKLLSQ